MRLRLFLERQALSLNPIQQKITGIFVHFANRTRDLEGLGHNNIENKYEAMMSYDAGSELDAPPPPPTPTPSPPPPPNKKDLAEQIKRKVNDWIAENRHALLEEDDQKVRDWLYESQNNHGGKGWKIIAGKPEHKEYKAKWEEKRQEQGGKIGPRAFSEHIRGKCRELLEKIVKDSDSR